MSVFKISNIVIIFVVNLVPNMIKDTNLIVIAQTITIVIKINKMIAR